MLQFCKVEFYINSEYFLAAYSANIEDKGLPLFYGLITRLIDLFRGEKHELIQYDILYDGLIISGHNIVIKKSVTCGYAIHCTICLCLFQ